MFGLHYPWLLTVRGFSVRLARNSLLTLAVGFFCLVCVLAPRNTPLTTVAAVTAPAAVSLQQTTDAKLPHMLVRLWILVPRLLPRR